MRGIRHVFLLVVLGMVEPTLAIAQQDSQTEPAPAASPATEPPAATRAQPQPEVQPQPEPQLSQPAAPSPALDFSPTTAQADKDEPLVEKWWFWSAIGAVVIGTVVAIALIDSGSSTPRTTLGNQEVRP